MKIPSQITILSLSIVALTTILSSCTTKSEPATAHTPEGVVCGPGG